MGGKRFRLVCWLAVLLPAASVGFFEFLRHQWVALPAWLGEGWAGNIVGVLVVAVVALVFVRVFAGILSNLALEASRSREEAAVAVERRRIAREMHDDTAQALFYLNVKLREVDDLISDGETKRARGELREAEAQLDDAYRRVRTVISDLKERQAEEDFGEEARRATAELAGRLGMRVTCEVEGRAVLPAPARKHLLAIVQEALTNAHRHGRAEEASVRVRSAGGNLKVEVSDRGAGFEPDVVAQEGRYGCAIMEERARMLGGRLDLDSAPGRGTRVSVSLPETLP